MSNLEYGKEIRIVDSWYSKWAHWNFRFFILGWIILGLLIYIIKGNPSVLIGVGIPGGIALLIVGRKSFWAPQKYVVHENGIFFPRGSKRTFDSEKGKNHFNIAELDKKEFVYFKDIATIENYKSLNYKGKMVITTSGKKYLIQQFSEYELLPYILPYINEKIDIS